jgi:hypothetical protein
MLLHFPSFVWILDAWNSCDVTLILIHEIDMGYGIPPYIHSPETINREHESGYMVGIP